MKIYEKCINARSGDSELAITVKDGQARVWMPGMIDPLIAIEGHPLVVMVDVPNVTASDVVLRTRVTREQYQEDAA